MAQCMPGSCEALSSKKKREKERKRHAHLKCQDNADKQKNNKYQTGRIH